MYIQNQADNELKHIGLLRKAIANKHPVHICFEGPEWEGSLQVCNGMINHSEEDLMALRKAVAKPVTHFCWESGGVLNRPDLACSVMRRALAEEQLDSGRLWLYQQVFSKMPPVQIRAGSLFSFSLGSEVKEFQKLYLRSLKEGVRVADYLNSATNPMILNQRIEVVMISYCAGDLVLPRAKPVDQRQVMASKILSRLQQR